MRLTVEKRLDIFYDVLDRFGLVLNEDEVGGVFCVLDYIEEMYDPNCVDEDDYNDKIVEWVKDTEMNYPECFVGGND